MADTAWKKNERDKCRQLGAERRGPNGGPGQCSDCKPLPLIAPEMKLYSKFVLLEADFQQAKRNAQAEGKMPVLSVKEKSRARSKRDRVVMEWDDFVQLYRLAIRDN